MKNFRCLASALFAVLMLWMSNLWGAGSEEGKIEFYGVIVEPLCDVSLNREKILTQCFRGGTLQVSHQNISEEGWRPMPLNKGKSNLKWLNSSHTLAIYTVQYN